MKHVLVVGAGVMGRGIAQAAAQAGYRVSLADREAAAARSAREQIEWSLTKMEAKGRMDGSLDAVKGRISYGGTLQAAENAAVVIEAVYEDLGVKQRLFRELSTRCPAHTVLGTNTSSLSVTEIASAAKDPERVVGIHFFNPVHRMRLVEVVCGLQTGNAAYEQALEFARALGKEPVPVRRDSAGFIVNRINGMAMLEALRLLERGVAEAADIDRAVRLGLGHPMGPFELMDLVGLDVVLEARLGIWRETRDPAHYPPPLLWRMVRAGRLGRKSGRGFYAHPPRPGDEKP